MINGRETTRDATTSEVPSPSDPFDSFPPLRAHQSDGDDAASPPSSRYSSCGDSEFDRYCSANSVMGTPSMCSTITLYNDFSELEFGSARGFGNGDDNNGLENFSLGGGRAEMNHNDLKLGTQRKLRYGSSGLELYGDGSDELAMNMLDSSGLIGFNRMVESSEECGGRNELKGVEGRVGIGSVSSDGNGNGNVGNSERCVLGNVDGNNCTMSMVTVGGGSLSCDQLDGFDARSKLDVGEREMEREEDGDLSDYEHSEGEDSVYKYGSDDDNKNESYLSRSIHYRKEPEARNENPLLINSSVAFGTDDLDDFLLENERCGRVSVMSDLFHNQREKNYEVEEDPINFGSVSSMGFVSAGQEGERKDKEDMVTINEKVEEIKDIGEPEAVKQVRDIPEACCEVQSVDKLTNVSESSTRDSTDFPDNVKPQVQGADKLVNCPKTSSISNAYEVDLDPLEEEAPHYMGLNVTDGRSMEKGNQYINVEEAIATSDAQQEKNQELDNSKFKIDHFSDSRVDQNSSNPSNHQGNINAKSSENLEQIVPPSNCGMSKTLESSSNPTNLLEKSPVMSKIEDFELNEFYDEVVQEMEDILLDSMDSPGARLTMGNRLLESQLSMPLRDGGLTASTSSIDDAYLLVQRATRIDRIEVVGARQKKGDVSFSERLVGVKEYTVYKIKVWSGKDQWEVERRYRDFLTLYRCMKTLFTEQGWILPLPWSSVDKESKIFRSASPDIIVKRSVLIQECLQSILHTRFFSSPPRALIWFLSPQDSQPISPVSNTPVLQSSFTRGANMRNFSPLGKTISLIVEIPPNKSVKQLLEAQHYTCAGCHKHFDDEKTLIWDFVQTFGWGKPRLCEYTGQLFCSSCHTNETAVLPARVLHHWDFTHYPVSQLAKSYLESIHDQPMLCVTAVNPILLSKVPALLHVMSVRKKIGTMLSYVRCPFRRSINRGLGNRRYLLESNDFFALRDLIDLSKGVFAALPVMVETLSRKILEHITDQCLICCDVGVPCSARQDCSDPSSLIFPFQEDDIERCKACQSVFHKRCFRKLANCSCGANLRLNETSSLNNRASQSGCGETRGTLDLLGRGLSSGLSSRFLSGLFTKEKPEKTREHKDENIILMGSLPSTSL